MSRSSLLATIRRQIEPLGVTAILLLAAKACPAATQGSAGQNVPSTERCTAAVGRSRRALAGSPEAVDARLALARILVSCHEYADAVTQYRQALDLDPRNAAATLGLAKALASSGDYAGALKHYDQVLRVRADDYDALEGKAFVLYWTDRFIEARAIFQRLHDQHPEDQEVATALRDVLEGLARVEADSNHLQDAIRIYQNLSDKNHGNINFQLEIARLETQAKNYPAARDALALALALRPRDRDIRFQLAQLETRQGQYRDALRQYDELLRQNPEDSEALFGKAQVSYYRGDVPGAYQIASKLVAQQPSNYDALFLLASLQNARGKRREALDLLQRADRLSPDNPEVVALRAKLEDESAVTVHTAASYAREISLPGGGNPPGFEHEDLRNWAYGTTVGMPLLPKSDSSFMLSYLPAEIPRGGVGGAVAPAEFLYRQTTPVVRSLITLRGGLGLVRFGPGLPVNFPNGAGPQPAAEVNPIGYLGATFAPEKRWSFDLTWSRSALAETPLAARLGVIESRREAGVNYRWNPRTEFHLTYYQARDTSESYAHLSTAVNPNTAQRIVINGRDYIKGSGGTLVFNRNLVHVGSFALDAGYSGKVYGYDGPRRGVFLGLFTPSYYQLHLLTTKLKAKVYGPLGYEFSGGIGIQQVDQRQALTRALILNPAFTLKLNRRVSLRLGYTHYDVAQAIGVVRGNAVELTTDWKF